MPHVYKLLSVLLVLPIFSFAQSNYKPGYVVKLNGDTVKGYIEFKTWLKNPNVINFKSGLDSESVVTSFSTDNAASFTITGSDRYKRFTTKISEDAVNGFGVSTGGSTKESLNTIFLKVLNSGKNITLYSYSDKLKIRYLVDENDGDPVELGLHVHADPNAPGETKTVETYKRQLEGLAVKYQPSDQSLIKEIEEAGYNADDISNVIFEINGSDKASTFIAANNYRFRPFVGAGVNLLSVHNFSNNDFLNPSQDLNYKNRTAVGEEIAFGEDIYLGKNENSLILRGAFQVSYSGGNEIYGKETDSLKLKYNTLNISINPQLLWDFCSGNGIKAYLDVGFELFFTGGTKNVTYTAPNFNYLNPPTYVVRDFSLTTRAEIDFHSKLGFYIGYDPVSNVGQKTNTLSTFHAGASYFFGN